MGSKKRIFKPASIFIGRSNVRTQIRYWIWTKGKGVSVVFEDSTKFKSEYNLHDLLSIENPTEVIQEKDSLEL